MAFFNLAREYQEAANHLFDRHSPDGSDPINFLYFHTLELALKAFLRSHGKVILGTRRKSHELTRLYEECRDLGLIIGPSDRFEIANIVSLMEEGNADQRFRYFNLTTGVIPDVSWTREVVEQLMRAVESHLNAHSGQILPGPAATFTLVIGKPVPK